MVSLTVNGQTVTVPDDAYLLQAVRMAGLDLPTLCQHDGLSPYGACRLCMVAIMAPSQELVAACAYPVEQGLAVETDTSEAVAARRLALEFLLARCPQSSIIREMAAEAGLTASRFEDFQVGPADELCMLCGLCVRVCHEAIGAAAISFVGRGSERRVASPFEVQAEACIGCGACAEICPTGAIQIEDRGSLRILHTFNTTIELLPCPSCGGFFAPAPQGILADMFPEIKELWSLCPKCRSQHTAQQWVEQVATGGIPE
jgi:predicted molibdopterin-dependent oxidoreductase YjgC